MNHEIKVLLVTHYYPAHRGGIEIVAGNLVSQLLDFENLTVHWMASDIDPAPPIRDGLTCIPAPTINWIENNLKLPYPLWSIASYLRLWKLVQLSDVVHIHDYLYLGNLLTFIFAKLQQKSIIVTQHIGFIPYKSLLFKNLLEFLNSTVGCFVLKNVDRTVFISEVVHQYFINKTRFRRFPLLIPNGVDIQIYSPCNDRQRQLERQKLDLPLAKPVFLFVGRFVEKKGLLTLKQLAQRFPEIYWVFAGWGAIAPEQWELPNVKVFRNLQGEQLVPVYRLADLLVLPSKGEGFPLVVQEAMACGTPVLIGKETAQAWRSAMPFILSETVDDEIVVEAWSKRIDSILADFSDLMDLREKVADFARETWSWDITARQYYSLYSELISPF